MNIKSILKKSLRSMRRNKSSYFSCILVLALGISVFLAMFSILVQMQDGIRHYYRDSRFGDVFAVVTAMPGGQTKALEKINGIAAAEGVLTKTVRVLSGDPGKVVTVKLTGAAPELSKRVNQYTYSGEPLKDNQDIWIGEAFYEAAGVKTGDRISLLLGKTKRDFVIRGTVKGPEYITLISEDAFLPDDEGYTVGYIKQSELEKALFMPGMVTEISFLLEEGVSFEDVEAVLEEELKPYGLKELCARKDQVSHFYLMDEISQLSVMGTVLPIVFLLVSFIMLYIMLKRLIEQERTQIGTFKAFGYTAPELLAGYLLGGGAVGISAFVLALGIGYPFGFALYANYTRMYSLPEPIFRFSPNVCLAGAFIALGVSVFSTVAGAASVFRIHPAESMRAKAPKIKGRGVRLDGKAVRYLFTKSGIMAIRSIWRNKVRSGLTVLSIVSAFATINVVYAMAAACTDTILEQPRKTELYELKAGLETPQRLNDLISQVKKLEGVSQVQGQLNFPMSLSHQNKQEQVMVCGTPAQPDFYRIVDKDGKIHTPPGQGILLGKILADKLKIKKGDVLTADSSYLHEPVRLLVTDVVEETMGPGCYMEIESLSKLFYPSAYANQIMIRAEADRLAGIQEQLAGFPNISMVTGQEQTLALNRQMLDSLLSMIYAFIVMAFLMGFGAIYNVSRISLQERQREFATMRILGYRIDETAGINAFEQWLMLLAGIAAGFIPAHILKDYLAALFGNDLYTLYVKLTPESTGIAVLCCAAAVFLSNLMAQKEIKNYQLAEALRERM